MRTYPIILEKAIKITINNLNTQTCSNSFDNYISHRDTVNINCEAVAPPCLQLQRQSAPCSVAPNALLQLFFTSNM